MAHKILITDGVVLGKRGVGEAHTLAALLTREAGLLYARATSARMNKSKLRYGLEPMTQARYCLVRGRNEWKITGVQDISRELLFAPSGARTAGGRVSRLLLRLIAGEEAFADLFQTVQEGLALLARTQEKSDIENLECMLVLRILWHLGYVANVSPIEQFLSGQLTTGLARDLGAARPMLIRTINESLKATGL